MEYQCFQCQMPLDPNKIIYKYCDATLCSKHCVNLREKHIYELDPFFKYPHMWQIKPNINKLKRKQKRSFFENNNCNKYYSSKKIKSKDVHSFLEKKHTDICNSGLIRNPSFKKDLNKQESRYREILYYIKNKLICFSFYSLMKKNISLYY
jgi:hypothetical protein